MLPSQPRRKHAAARFLFSRTALSAILLAAFAASVQAQIATSTAPTAAESAAALERAKRDGDKVFQWIRLHSDKPRKAAAAPAAAEKAPVAAAPAAPKVAAKATAKPADSGITETVQPIPAPRNDTQLAAGKPGPQPAALQPEPVSQQVAARSDASAPLVGSAASPQVEIEEDAVLTPTFRSEPDFPGALMRTLRKGMVQVAFVVQPDGTVAQARAVSTTHPRLSQSAVATVAQWKFRPLRHAQEAVVDLGFNLD